MDKVLNEILQPIVVVAHLVYHCEISSDLHLFNRPIPGMPHDRCLTGVALT
ncbi:hypothetical protein [Leptodesmis sichuanensis]|uniref:hypothetical protein n=1 Tax=Leptodesmis sichuanensis TaxID=2906798 RepID=UPI001F383258|nr:hypothetical protein [Leptodesmis sichuanensis]UIE39650.1 hypothetical protein KIK02_08885 [Leptodesmis sichuanensis A121]